MSDYIKREDAQRALAHTLKDAEIDTACNEQDWYCQGLMDAEVAIDAVPSGDVVEVVRCKDCKYNKAKDENKGVCGLMVYVHNADDYCSYGEREEQENE